MCSRSDRLVQGGVLDYFGERRAHRHGVVGRDECEGGVTCDRKRSPNEIFSESDQDGQD